MPAFGVNRFTQAYAVAVNDAGTRINDKPISCVDRLASDLWRWRNQDLKLTFQFLYPFVGGSAVSNSFNLADPDTARIAWEDTVTHNANGITGDGVSGLGDTGQALRKAGDTITLSETFVACGVYSRTASTGNWSDIGNVPSPSATTPARDVGLICRYTDGNAYFYNGPEGGTTYFSVAVANAQGLFVSLQCDYCIYGY
jgi:hypothetical protein